MQESMFKVLYRCNRTIERHTNSPLADSRRRYLEHLAAGGASPNSRRLLVDQDGKPKFVLQRGERKSIATDRVILIPGPRGD